MSFQKKTSRMKKNKVGNRSGSRTGGMRLATHPPRFIAQAVRQMHLRLQATAALVSVNFTVAELANYLGLVAVTAATYNYLSQAFRLKHVSVWGPVATAGTPITVALVWNTLNVNFTSPPVEIVDTAVSFDWPGYISSVPPIGSLSDKWHASDGNNTLFTLTCPIGSTVDFTFDWILSDRSLLASAFATGGATIGEIYHAIQHTLTPVGVNSN